MIDQGCFLFGMACVLTHELDAMKAREWLIFPGLARLSDELGEQVFIAIHVPLFAIVLWGPFLSESRAQWMHGLSLFFIAHMLAHGILHGHPKNGFRRALSWLWIVGAAAGGAGYLMSV